MFVAASTRSGLVTVNSRVTVPPGTTLTQAKELLQEHRIEKLLVVDDASEQRFAHRHFENAAGATAGLAFRQALVVAQDNGTDRIALEVECEAEGVFRELDHLALHGVFEPVDASDTVGDTDYRAFVARFGGDVEFLYAFFDQLADFRWIQCRLHRLFSH